MTVFFWTLVLVIPLVGVGFASRAVFRSPRGEFEAGVAFILGRWYVRLVHHLQVHGREHIPENRAPGPIIVVANHTAGIDPILIQAVCPFEIRWLMASDMRAPALEWFWKWQRIIFIGRDRSDNGVGMRTAIAHLRSHGVIGTLPEGGTERPPQQILPFNPGLGMMIRRSHARVLPVFIDGTPQVDPAWASLWKTSNARIEFGPMMSFERSLSANEIATQIQQHFLDWSGWSLNESPDKADIESGKTASPYARPMASPDDDERSAA